MHKFVVLHAHAPVKNIGVGFFAVPVGFFRERKPRSVGGGSCFLDKLRRQPVVVGFDKFPDIAISVFVVAAHPGGQLVKVPVLAKIAGIIAVYHNGGRVSLFDFFHAASVLRVENIAHFKVEIFSVPRTSRFPKRHPSDTVP